MISGALVLPDLMTFLMALPFLMIELPCLLAALMHVTGSMDVSFNTLACLLDGCLGDCGILEVCDIGLVIDDDEDLFPSLFNDEANLFNFSNNDANVCGWCSVEEFALPIVTCLVSSSLREG